MHATGEYTMSSEHHAHFRDVLRYTEAERRVLLCVPAIGSAEGRWREALILPNEDR